MTGTVQYDGLWLVCLVHPHTTLWIPAYAGMTVMRCWNDRGLCSGLVCSGGVGFYPVKVDVFA